MANSVPASYPVPDPVALSTGRGIASDPVPDLFAAMNWNRARLGACNLVSAVWPTVGGNPLWQDTRGGFGALPACLWYIPEVTRSRTSVAVSFLADGPVGSVARLTSGFGGDVQGVAINGPGWYTATLAIDASGGHEVIGLDTHGDGTATPCIMRTFSVRAPVLSSPLDPGVDDRDGFVAFDAAEHGAGEPLASDAAARMIVDLQALDATPHVYCQWSAIRGVSMAGGLIGTRMAARPHVVPARIWLGAQRRGWDLTVNVRAKGGAADAEVIVGFGPDVMPPYVATARIVVPAGAAEARYTATLQPTEGRRLLRSLPDGLSSGLLTVWPIGTSGVIAHQDQRGHRPERLFTGAEVRTVSIWGR